MRNPPVVRIMPPRSKCYASSTGSTVSLKRYLTIISLVVTIGLTEAQKGIFFGCYQRDRSGQLELLTDSLDKCVEHCENGYFRYGRGLDSRRQKVNDPSNFTGTPPFRTLSAFASIRYGCVRSRTKTAISGVARTRTTPVGATMRRVSTKPEWTWPGQSRISN